jgi:DNA-binding transcriptional ArsR family regulator
LNCPAAFTHNDDLAIEVDTLSKLIDAALVTVEEQGQHRYFQLADQDVASLLRISDGRRLSHRLGTHAVQSARACAAQGENLLRLPRRWDGRGGL